MRLLLSLLHYSLLLPLPGLLAEDGFCSGGRRRLCKRGSIGWHDDERGEVIRTNVLDLVLVLRIAEQCRGRDVGFGAEAVALLCCIFVQLLCDFLEH